MAVKILAKREKQSSEQLDYPVDFSEWADGREDAPASFTVAVAGSDSLLEVVASTLEAESWTVWLMLAAGTPGVTYKVTVKLTTDAAPPAIKEADFTMRIKDV